MNSDLTQALQNNTFLIEMNIKYGESHGRFGADIYIYIYQVQWDEVTGVKNSQLTVFTAVHKTNQNLIVSLHILNDLSSLFKYII